MKKRMSLLMACLIMLSCAAFAQSDAPVRVAALMGPTGMGMTQMMDENDGAYAFTLAAAPEELSGGLIGGSIDIAAVPTNLASVLYNKTNGGVQILALNTLGVLHIMDKDGAIHTVSDLAGRTVTLAGQGATPQYVLEYLLDAYGVTDCTLDFRSEHSEVSALAASGLADVVLLPEPHVTALLMKNAGYRAAVDVSDAFAQAAATQGMDGTVMSMGCLVARTAFIKENPETVRAFMDAYARSVAFVNEQPALAAQSIEKNGVLPKAAIALRAIPNCHVVCVTGDEMKTQVKPFFDILFAANPASVGGKTPDDGFYYIP